MDFSASPLTLMIIVVNVILSMIGFSSSSFLGKAVMWPYKVKREGQWYRFISSGFIHADWMHLIFNMFTFYFFGRNMEIILQRAIPNGALWFLFIYFTGLVVADIPSYLKHKDDPQYRSLGASGAVSAVVFAAVVFDPWSQLRLYGFISMSAMVFAILYIVYCVYMSKKSADNVNHDAHLWGALFGLIATLVLMLAMRPDILPFMLEDLKNPSLTGRREIGATLKHLLY